MRATTTTVYEVREGSLAEHVVEGMPEHLEPWVEFFPTDIVVE